MPLILTALARDALNHGWLRWFIALSATYRRNEIVDILLENGVTGFKKNLSVSALARWVCDNISVEDVFPDAVAISFAPDFVKGRRTVYSYLHSQFEEPPTIVW